MVESFIKRRDMVIEATTDANYELASNVLFALLEVEHAKNSKDNSKKLKIFPTKPKSRTSIGRLREEREQTITRAMTLLAEKELKSFK